MHLNSMADNTPDNMGAAMLLFLHPDMTDFQEIRYVHDQYLTSIAKPRLTSSLLWYKSVVWRRNVGGGAQYQIVDATDRNSSVGLIPRLDYVQAMMDDAMYLLDLVDQLGSEELLTVQPQDSLGLPVGPPPIPLGTQLHARRPAVDATASVAGPPTALFGGLSLHDPYSMPPLETMSLDELLRAMDNPANKNA